MLKREWVPYVVIGLVLFLAMGSLLIWYYHVQANQREKAAFYHAAGAYQHANESCSEVMGLAKQRECLVKEYEIYLGEAYTHYELNAQQDMAVWAFGMLLATLMGIGITGLGVYLVWQTLIETKSMLVEAKNTTNAAQDTVEVTRNIGNAQLRAYVSIVEPTRLAQPPLDGGDGIASLTIRNCGQTPAYDMLVRYVGTIIPAYDTSKLDDIGYADNVFSKEVLSPGDSREINVKTQILNTEQAELFKNKKLAAFFVGRIEYIDFTGKSRWTNFRLFNGGPDAPGRLQLSTWKEGNDAN